MKAKLPVKNLTINQSLQFQPSSIAFLSDSSNQRYLKSQYRETR